MSEYRKDQLKGRALRDPSTLGDVTSIGEKGAGFSRIVPDSDEILAGTEAGAETPEAGPTKKSFRREFNSPQFQSKAA